MFDEVAFDSISERVAQREPIEGTLTQILSLIMGDPSHALSRIWLIKKGDICSRCLMRPDCKDLTKCLHLTASRGRDSTGLSNWSELEGRYRRFPIGFRKIGFVAETGEAVLINNLDKSDHSWILDREWIIRESIKGVAALPLRFQEDILGVIAVFARETISDANFKWLGIFADQASIAIANARALVEVDRQRERLRDENEYLKQEIEESAPHKFLIGSSLIWKKVLAQIEMVANSDATVLLTGESGTGKELVARAIHESSSRRHRPMVRVNCAAISRDLFESEFFGHVKGAFTGAISERKGRFQLADAGTIFLDEIAELPLSMQGKLLRVLQEGEFERLGEDRTRKVDVRVIAATNRDLSEEVVEGRFREDLFYRLSVFPIRLPALRERTDDVQDLTLHFVKRFAEKMQCKKLKVTKEDIQRLQNYPFPGNVRELENVVERAMILSQCDQLRVSLPNVLSPAAASGEDIPEDRVLTVDELKRIERENIVRALQRTNYKVYGEGGAARLLGSKPTTLFSRIKALGIPMRP